ncbi:MAG: glycoside hydrolase family 75 protein [Chthoniobacterales bacterium]
MGFRVRTLRWFALLLFLALFSAVVLRWISLERWRWSVMHEPETPERIVERTPTPEPTARTRVITGKLETARLFNGITVRPAVEPTPGRAASEERVDPESYVLDLKLRIRTPAANRTVDELAKVNPELPRLLPGLSAMVKEDSLSPYFNELYETKLKSLRQNLSRLDQLLSRHNYYDCQTVLDLRHPDSKRKAVLLQSEMDSDADGSDADRVPAGSGTSPTFQPFTSYKWQKKTKNPNPYLPQLEEKANRFETESKTANADRKRELKNLIAQTRDEIATLKAFSFLIGATDPFIVIPFGFTKTSGAKVGDYAVVVSENAIYPAIVGDVGPADKTGEASLRIAKEISSSATAMNRAVDDLKITYLIFPGTAETSFGPPDLDKINARCEALVNEIGGAGVPVHKWVSIIPTPTPTPTPSPTPSPSPSPSPSASPSPTSSPDASPSPTFAFPIPSPSATPPPSPTATVTPSPSASAVVRHKKSSKKG